MSRRCPRISTWTSSRCRVRDTAPKVVLGIDPGTATTGYGIVRKDGRNPLTLVECGVIRTKPRDSLAQRLAEIHEGIADLISRHSPNVLSIEDIFYARNVRTTVVLGHARGVILLAAAQAGLEIHEFPPAEIKKAVAGTGAATKLQVQFMVAQLLRLKSAPQPTDAADGVAAALCYALAPDLPAIMSVVPPLRQLARQAEAAALADIPGRVIGVPPR
jgi:crossover junction endodeoxyribonuclease RuvC